MTVDAYVLGRVGADLYPLQINTPLEEVRTFERFVTMQEREAAVSAINRMLEGKTLINNVALSLPLNDIVAAHEAVQQGKAIGNVVVTL